MADRITKIINFLQDDPENTFLLFALAKEYENDEQTEKAIAKYKELLDIDPKYTGAYYHLAQLLGNIDQVPTALEYIDKGIECARAKSEQKDLRELRELQVILGG